MSAPTVVAIAAAAATVRSAAAAPPGKKVTIKNNDNRPLALLFQGRAAATATQVDAAPAAAPAGGDAAGPDTALVAEDATQKIVRLAKAAKAKTAARSRKFRKAKKENTNNTTFDSRRLVTFFPTQAETSSAWLNRSDSLVLHGCGNHEVTYLE